MKKESMLFPFRWIKSLEMLGDAEFRAMVTAIIEYAESGVEPSFSGAMACAWQEYKQRIDNDRERYAQICEVRRQAGMKGAEFGHLGGRPRKHPAAQETAKGVLETPKNPKETTKTPDPDPDPYYDPKSISIFSTPIAPPLDGGGGGEDGLPFDDKPAKDTQETTPDTVQDQLKARINALFKRRNTTAWSDKERKALRDVSKRDGVLDEMTAIEALYNSGYPYRRRDVYTFLNNFATEFDRAQNRQQTSGFNREGSEGSYGRYTPRNG